jgi:hypothetical protein
MHPWQSAKKWQLENSEIPFEELLGSFFSEGYVWSSPTEFILFRQCRWEFETMCGGDVEPNCWAIQLAAGKNPMARFMELAPKKLKYVAWQRRGSDRYHVWNWDKFNKKVKKWDQQAK